MAIDQREHNPTLEELLRMTQEDLQRRLWTAIPATVQAFNAAAGTVDALPFYKGHFPILNADDQIIPMPLITDCPVLWQGGGGATLTFPIAKGDECLLIFASRCIDNWWQNGGQQEAAIVRMHSLSDGFALVGIHSLPRMLSPAPSTTKTQLRSDDGTTIIELDASGQKLNLTAPGGTTINANTTINGTLHVTGNIQCDATVTGTTDVVGGGKSLKTHVHSGVTAGASNTGAPV